MKYIILLLIPFISFAQVDVPEKYWLDDSNFENTILPGGYGDDDDSTIVVEFWAEFNEENCFAEWNKIKDAKYYRVDIAAAPKTKKEYRIRMAPTILIFKNGVVEESFKAGLDLLLPTDLDEIQNAIHDINTASNF